MLVFLSSGSGIKLDLKRKGHRQGDSAIPAFSRRFQLPAGVGGVITAHLLCPFIRNLLSVLREGVKIPG